jgi:hypothetical protein
MRVVNQHHSKVVSYSSVARVFSGDGGIWEMAEIASRRDDTPVVETSTHGVRQQDERLNSQCF